MEQRLHSETETVDATTVPYQSASLSQETEPVQAYDKAKADALLTVLQEEERKRRHRRPWLLSGAAIAFVLMLVLTVTKSLSAGRFRPESGLFSTIFILLLFAYSASRTHRAATREAAALEDLRLVGPMTEALEFSGRGLHGGTERGEAINALVRLLPQLQASDAALLDSEQRGILNRTLKGDSLQSRIAMPGLRFGAWGGLYGGFFAASLLAVGPRYRGRGRLRRGDNWHGKHTELVLAILQAYEQVGDSAALPFVESLAEGKGPASVEPRIQEAAERCLPALRLLAQKELERQRLLRAADAQENPSEVLLRPAQGSTTGDPETLLRASTAQDADRQ